MSDHEGPLQFLVESAKKAFLRGLFSDLLPRNIRQVVNSLLGDYCKLACPEGSHHPAVMETETIDISSSSDDSDLLRQIDNYGNESPVKDSATSSQKRVLPETLLSLPSSSNGGGITGSSRRRGLELSSNDYGRSLNVIGITGSSRRPLEQSSNDYGRSLNVIPVPASARQQMHARFSGNGGLSHSFASGSGNGGRSHSFASGSGNGGRSHSFASGSGNGGRSHSFASGSGNGGRSHSFASGSDHSVYVIEDDDIDNELHSSKRPKRTIQPPLPGSNRSTNNFVENIGGSQFQFRDRQGTSYQSSRLNSESYTRVLPQSMSGKSSNPHGKSSNSHAYGKASEPSQNWGIGEERSAETDERLVFQAALQDINQPNTEATLPEGLLSVPLLRHQKIALAWMIKRETEGRNCLGGILADDQGLGKTVSMIAIIQMLKSLQEEFKSENLRNSKAEAFNLDDDDDDGDKNESAHDKQKKIEVDDSKVVPEESSSHIRNKKPAAGTLVVCPASVLRQWNRELEDKVTEEAKLSVLIYHGGNRTKDASELAKYDVVLTTYAIVNNEAPKKPSADEEENEQNNVDMYGLSSEFSFSKISKKASINKKGKKRKHGIEYDVSDSDRGAIARVRWFRVILDEAQTIKNHRTQVARACCSLRAKKRWCLSGTPIQNAIEELFSYFRFLKFDPYWRYKAFYEGIKLQISRDSTKGYAKLQVILRSLMLRRTKGTVIDGQPIISLPPKDIQLAKVEFSQEERSYYTNLESETRKQFKAYAAAGTVNQNYANILLMLLRLRQACDHPLLVEGVGSKFPGRKGSLGIPKNLPKEKLCSLLNLLEASSAICYVCKDPPEDAVVSVCEHVFCFQCVSDYLTGEDNTCPVSSCKTQLNSDVLFSENALKKSVYGDETGDAFSSSGVYERSSVLKNDYSSSKIKALLEILQECYTTNSSSEKNAVALSKGNSSSGNPSPESLTSKPIKAIVFSQWTGMLDLIEVSLKNTGLIYRRLDGGMSLAARDKAVKEFNINPEVTVMLMSLKAGNLGLNMVAACRVILLDLWWNPTTEDQAIDRAHRIGQTRPVIVSRLTIKDSVEDRILALQAEKRKMVASAYGEDQSGKKSGTGLSMDDLKYLFGV